MGGSADTHATHGRDSRKRTRSALAVQRHKRRKRTGRMAGFGARSVGKRGQRLAESDGSVQDGSVRRRGVRIHSQRRSVQTGQRGDGARLRLPYPHQAGKQMHRRESKREERATETEVEQRRSGGDHDIQHADPETGLAEYRNHLQSAHQDTPGTERDGSGAARLCQETLERKFKNRR